jgi:hypothetical protein
MKREDLVKLGIAEDVVNQIMALHGADIENHKQKLTAKDAEAESLKGQLTEAAKAIDGFKAMDIDGVKKAAEEWKAKAEQATAAAAQQLAALKFDHALDGALTGAKAKNAKAVKALLDSGALKYNEADGSIIGLNDQLAKIKSENDYLFESDKPTPQIITGGNNQNVISDAVVMAARKAAGLPLAK